jgi:hypothetical protein
MIALIFFKSPYKSDEIFSWGAEVCKNQPDINRGVLDPVCISSAAYISALPRDF